MLISSVAERGRFVVGTLSLACEQIPGVLSACVQVWTSPGLWSHAKYFTRISGHQLLLSSQEGGGVGFFKLRLWLAPPPPTWLEHPLLKRMLRLPSCTRCFQTKPSVAPLMDGQFLFPLFSTCWSVGGEGVLWHTVNPRWTVQLQHPMGCILPRACRSSRTNVFGTIRNPKKRDWVKYRLTSSNYFCNVRQKAILPLIIWESLL